MNKEELIKILEKVDIEFGSVKIQIRNGKPALVTEEKTTKLD